MREGRTDLWRTTGAATQIAVGCYIALDSALRPLFRPVARAFARLPPVVWIERGAACLPAYAALIALAIPYFAADPAKVYGLYLTGRGHFVAGPCCIASAYLVSLLIVDRIFEGARPALMSILWFAALVNWLIDARSRARERLGLAEAEAKRETVPSAHVNSGEAP